jgi:Putative methyltransferase
VSGSRIDRSAEGPRPQTDWLAWHRAYDDPDSVVSRRLAFVRSMVSSALDAAPDGPIRLLSICAGDGRDVLGVLSSHPRGGDVDATLVEQHPALTAAALATAIEHGLDKVRCELGDAGLAKWYATSRPIEVLVACGVFGNISSEDLRRTVRCFGAVVGPGGHVIWTRHRQPPDQTPVIRRWFEESGFAQVSFCEVPNSLSSVACHRRGSEPAPMELPTRLFEFVGDGAAAHH